MALAPSLREIRRLQEVERSHALLREEHELLKKAHGARYPHNSAGEHQGVAELLLEAGARPGPNLSDAPDAVLAVIRSYTGGVS